MPGPEFFQTRMGHTFYEGTMPRIAAALERIAKALEDQQKDEAVSPADNEPVGVDRDLTELATQVQLLTERVNRVDRRE